MALTYADAFVWDYLERNAMLPQSFSLLEIGEANWYGDVSPQVVMELCKRKGTKYDGDSPFTVAQSFFGAYGTHFSAAVDLDPAAPNAERHDLNEPLPESMKACLQPGIHGYDVVNNTGTTEHIFNQCQVFKTIHDFCNVDGLMIHGGPWRGWTDHGFYNYQPTFFLDLAHANKYEVVLLFGFVLGTTWISIYVEGGNQRLDALYAAATARSLPDECMLYCVLGKSSSESFKSPQQGVYSNRLSTLEMAHWKNLRSG